MSNTLMTRDFSNRCFSGNYKHFGSFKRKW